MKAVVYERYGGPEVLRVEEVPTPSPAAGQVLVKIAATSINLSDWEGLRGSPFYARLGGLRAPRRPTLGSDIAGLVEAVGQGVTRFQPGDEVYGDNLPRMGGFAQYAVAPESMLAVKPVELTFAEASTIPQAGPIALQGTSGAAAGRRVLINGAGGGSGAFAIQQAKRLGAHVTGVDNADKLDFMRALGADQVIDYRTTRFAEVVKNADLVVDTIGGATQEDSWSVLKPGGMLVATATPPSPERGQAAGVRSSFIFTVPSGAVLEELALLIDSGQLRPLVGREMALADAAKAHALLESGQSKGKIVLHVGQP